MKLFLAGFIAGTIICFLLVGLFSPEKFRSKNPHSNQHEAIDDKKNDSKWPWPDSLDAVKAAPGSHRVLFENDELRILEVSIPPFGFEPMHIHRFPSVMFGSGYDSSQFDIIYYRYDYDPLRHIYFAKDSNRQHSGGQTTDAKTANFMKSEGPHRIRNLSNVRIDAFRVEFKPEKNKN